MIIWFSPESSKLKTTDTNDHRKTAIHILFTVDEFGLGGRVLAFRGDQVVLPAIRHRRIMALVHERYKGLTKMNSVLHAYVFWWVCIKVLKNLFKLVPIATYTREVTTWNRSDRKSYFSMAKIGIDIAGTSNDLDESILFTIIDYTYSRFPFVFKWFKQILRILLIAYPVCSVQWGFQTKLSLTTHNLCKSRVWDSFEMKWH